MCSNTLHTTLFFWHFDIFFPLQSEKNCLWLCSYSFKQLDTCLSSVSYIIKSISGRKKTGLKLNDYRDRWKLPQFLQTHSIKRKKKKNIARVYKGHSMKSSGDRNRNLQKQKAYVEFIWGNHYNKFGLMTVLSMLVINESKLSLFELLLVFQ